MRQPVGVRGRSHRQNQLGHAIHSADIQGYEQELDDVPVIDCCHVPERPPVLQVQEHQEYTPQQHNRFPMRAADQSTDAAQSQGNPQALDDGNHHHDVFEKAHESVPVILLAAVAPILKLYSDAIRVLEVNFWLVFPNVRTDSDRS